MDQVHHLWPMPALGGAVKYRARPVIIQAERFYERHCHQLPGEWRRALCCCRNVVQGDPPLPWHIHTLEGPMMLREGDYMVRGLAGEFYPVKPEMFEAKYEAVP